MKITKYEKLMLKIEKLAKNKEENSEALAALSLKLAAQKEALDRVSIKKIQNKLKNKDLSYNEYCNLKDLLKEKKTYIKKAALIDEVIAGNYENVHQKRRVVFRRFTKVLATGLVLAMVAGGLYSCNHNDNIFTKLGKTIEKSTDDDKDDNKDKDNNNDDTKDNKDKSTEKAENDSEKDSKDKKDSKDEKDKKEEKDTEDKDDEDKKDEKNTDQQGKKPTDSTTVSSNDDTNTTDPNQKTTTTSKVIPEKKIKVPTEGDLPVQPSTEDQSDKNKPTIEPGKTTEEEPSTETPSIDKVDEDEKDETTHKIPSDNTGEDEGKKPAPKQDTTEEEQPSDYTPSLDNIDEDEKDEITYEINDKGEVVPVVPVTPGKYEDKTEEEQPSDYTPSIEKIDEDEKDEITHFTPSNCNEVSTETQTSTETNTKPATETNNNTNTESKQDKIEEEQPTDATPSLDKVEEDETESKQDDSSITISDDIVVTPGETTWIEYKDTYEEEQPSDYTPSLDNIDGDEEDEITYTSSNGNTYVLTLA